MESIVCYTVYLPRSLIQIIIVMNFIIINIVVVIIAVMYEIIREKN